MSSESLKPAILLVMANKQDLMNCMSIPEIEKSLEIEKLKQIACKRVIGTSAINEDGLEKCLNWIEEQYGKLKNEWISVKN